MSTNDVCIFHVEPVKCPDASFVITYACTEKTKVVNTTEGIEATANLKIPGHDARRPTGTNPHVVCDHYLVSVKPTLIFLESNTLCLRKQMALVLFPTKKNPPINRIPTPQFYQLSHAAAAAPDYPTARINSEQAS